MRSYLPRRLHGLVIAAVLSSTSAPAVAQGVDCRGLQDQLAALGRTGHVGRLDLALRQQRAELERDRAYADESGCGGALFDDVESDQCRSLTGRIDRLEAELQRLEAQAATPDPGAEDRRRALTEAYDRSCGGDAAADPTVTMPVDPDAPIQAPAEAPRRVAQVLCVRQCDGAYYPLATGVETDRMGDMDRICQAQCPAAESSAYSSRDGGDVAGATTADGAAYESLATAFKFRQGTAPGCSCRAPHQSWADALAGAEALLETHEGDITVTPRLAADMARPVQRIPAATKPPSDAKPPRKAATSKAPVADAAPDAGAAPDADLMRELRRSSPTP